MLLVCVDLFCYTVYTYRIRIYIYIYISTNLISKLADENIFHHIPLLLGITLTNWESRDFARQRVMGVRQWSWGNHQLSIASCHSKMYLHSIYSNIIYIYMRLSQISTNRQLVIRAGRLEFWRFLKTPQSNSSAGGSSSAAAGKVRYSLFATNIIIGL